MAELNCDNMVNLLSPNGFKFAITKLPDVTYNVQQVSIPQLTLADTDMTNLFASIPIPGNRLTYDPLTIQFLVDEEMRNYKSIYNWLIGLGIPTSFQDYIAFKSSADASTLDGLLAGSELSKGYSYATLDILGSNNVSVQTIQFVDLFPISIESLTFQSTNTDVNYLTATATFRFSYYKFL